jgi:hypothetical protein
VVELEYQRARCMSLWRVRVRLLTSSRLLLGLPTLVVWVPVQMSPPAMKTLGADWALVGASSRLELQKRSVPAPLGRVRCPASGAPLLSQMS